MQIAVAATVGQLLGNLPAEVASALPTLSPEVLGNMRSTLLADPSADIASLFQEYLTFDSGSGDSPPARPPPSPATPLPPAAPFNFLSVGGLSAAVDKFVGVTAPMCLTYTRMLEAMSEGVCGQIAAVQACAEAPSHNCTRDVVAQAMDSLRPVVPYANMVYSGTKEDILFGNHVAKQGFAMVVQNWPWNEGAQARFIAAAREGRRLQTKYTDTNFERFIRDALDPAASTDQDYVQLLERFAVDMKNLSRVCMLYGISACLFLFAVYCAAPPCPGSAIHTA